MNHAVELPSGFPQTEREAQESADFAGCPREFARDIWHKAMGRGGRDSKEALIRNWRHYLKTEYGYEKNRQEREKSRDLNGRPPPKSMIELESERLLRQAQRL